jgi:hypothetical protein
MPNLLIDTNLLVLLLIGRWDRDRVPRFRRTQVFSSNDFDILEQHLRLYQKLITTVPVLTEVSNLMGNSFHAVIAPTIVEVCEPFDEHAATKHAVFRAFFAHAYRRTRNG